MHIEIPTWAAYLFIAYSAALYMSVRAIVRHEIAQALPTAAQRELDATQALNSALSRAGFDGNPKAADEVREALAAAKEAP